MKGSGPLVATVLAASTVALTSSSSTGVQHVTSSPISSNQVMSAKPLLKEALQAERCLPCDRDVPVIGFITRLEQQKGSDILAVAIPKFIGKIARL